MHLYDDLAASVSFKTQKVLNIWLDLGFGSELGLGLGPKSVIALS